MYHRSRLILFGLMLFLAIGASFVPGQAQRSPRRRTPNSGATPSESPSQKRVPPKPLQNAADSPFEASPGSGEHVSFQDTGVRLDAAVEVDNGATEGGTVGGPFTDAGDVRVESAGLVINATFDTSITGNANSAAIQSMINQAIGIYQSLFKDPVTVSILFRYSTTAPDGTPLSSGILAKSNFTIYTIPWTTFVPALIADAKTANDATANGSLPATPLTTNVVPSSAGGRAVGLNTPPAMFADSHVAAGGPYDGIVTLNSNQAFMFTRPVVAGSFDAQRSTEHEIDEVLGLGSFLNASPTNVRPQDLFSWSSAGTRNLTSTGTRYFSINGGTTNIVGFNQNSTGDFGDWLSASCPQANPYVQNAFSCAGQMSDVLATSPEGINLDVVGYDVVLIKAPFDFDGDRKTDIAVWRPLEGNWYVINSSTGSGQLRLWGVSTDKIVPGDYDGDAKTDFAIWRPSEGNWYIINSSTGQGTVRQWGLPTDIPVPGDYDGDGKTDIAVWRPSEGKWYIINSSTGQGTTRVWGINSDKPVPGDYDGDGKTDFAVWRPQEGNWYVAFNRPSGGGILRTWGVSTDMLVPADYDGDGKTDFAVWRPSEGNWYVAFNSPTGGGTLRQWGLSTDVPVPGDYDGDGKTDFAIWRPAEGNWYIINSSTGVGQLRHWGMFGDVPVPSAFIR